PSAARLAPRRDPGLRLRPGERLRLLCDPGSFVTDDRRPAGAVMSGSGRVDGRPVACYAHDFTIAGGSLGQAEADVVVGTLRAARRAGMPVVGFIESAGARLQEGVLGLDAYA